MSTSLRISAFADLLKRYGTVFQTAWQQRADNDDMPRLPYEAQFLPAALALQDTPVGPAPRVAMRLLMAFSALALLWAGFGRLDIVATAQGKIIANGRTKTIQPFETATVSAIHVVDGQRVNAGAALIDLDATGTRADKARILNDLAVARLQVARQQALFMSLKTGRTPKLERSVPADESLVREAERLLSAQYDEYLTRRNRIDAEISKREAEWNSIQEQVDKLQQTVPIAEQRAQDFRNLVQKNFVSRHDYLDREQARIEQVADLASQRSRLKEIDAALNEARSQRLALTAETQRSSLDSLNEGRQKLAALEQELLKADARNNLMRLTAPVTGTVQQLAVHTVGGVVTPAQPVMLIVPDDHPLEVEAFIENKDIGFVKPGQDSEIKIETFPYTKYGTIHAGIVSVSHDAINDEKRGLIYAARVKPDRSTITVDGTDVNLSPGMAVSVEIKTGKRRVIEYFLNPLLQYRHESLRER